MGLPTRILGRTGLEVTQLGFGAMEILGERICDGQLLLCPSGEWPKG